MDVTASYRSGTSEPGPDKRNMEESGGATGPISPIPFHAFPAPFVFPQTLYYIYGRLSSMSRGEVTVSKPGGVGGNCVTCLLMLACALRATATAVAVFVMQGAVLGPTAELVLQGFCGRSARTAPGATAAVCGALRRAVVVASVILSFVRFSVRPFRNVAHT